MVHMLPEMGSKIAKMFLCRSKNSRQLSERFSILREKGVFTDRQKPDAKHKINERLTLELDANPSAIYGMGFFLFFSLSEQVGDGP